MQYSAVHLSRAQLSTAFPPTPFPQLTYLETIMKTKLMYLTIPNAPLDSLIIEPNYASDDHEFVFECDMQDNPLDADDPENYLRDYYKSTSRS
jgi:hypothetical protein